MYHDILQLAPELSLRPLYLPEVSIYQIVGFLVVKAPVIIVQGRATRVFIVVIITLIFVAILVGVLGREDGTLLLFFML